MISNLENTKKGNKSAKKSILLFFNCINWIFFCVLTDQVYSTYDINYFEEEKEKKGGGSESDPLELGIYRMKIFLI